MFCPRLLLLLLTFSLKCHSFPGNTRHSRSLYDMNNCNHKFPTTSELPHHVRLAGTLRQKRAAKQQMKIKVLYHKSVDALVDWKRDIVKERVVPDAVTYWQNILKVVNSGKTILLNRKCENNQYFLSPEDPTQYCKNRCVETTCGEWVVPDEHLEACSTCDESGRNCETKKRTGKGVSGVDFILYVSAEETSQCVDNVAGQAETVAYAAHCQQEEELDRPVAGHTNICPGSIKKPVSLL
jgi:leishmanolysin-like peptidase